MRPVINDHSKCTGCAACRDICPKNCISMHADALDAMYPMIDESVCVGCGLCEKICPAKAELTFKAPDRVLVGWSNDRHVRLRSASGGVAYELYRTWIRNSGVAVGVTFDMEAGCRYVLIESEEDIKATQNSKYTFSDTAGIYKTVREKLRADVPVLFIGLPCQVAGLHAFLDKEYDNLTMVDIICHGVPPQEYLRQHISDIETRKHRKAEYVSFRDPEFSTHTYMFTLRDSACQDFYRKPVLAWDNYQLGYHKALIYRENCYSCRYARKERVGDLTIGDFSGLGRCAPFTYEKLSTSCILQNTEKGARLLAEASTLIAMLERPAAEAFEYEKQLKAPSVRHPKRKVFECEYVRTRSYGKAAAASLRGEKVKVIRDFAKRNIKMLAYKMLVALKIKR